MAADAEPGIGKRHLNRFIESGAICHQRRAGENAAFECAQDAGIDTAREAEIVRIDYQSFHRNRGQGPGARGRSGTGAASCWPPAPDPRPPTQ